MRPFAIEVLVLVALMLTGSAIAKPIGWVILFFACLAFFLLVLGGLPTH